MSDQDNSLTVTHNCPNILGRVFPSTKTATFLLQCGWWARAGRNATAIPHVPWGSHGVRIENAHTTSNTRMPRSHKQSKKYHPLDTSATEWIVPTTDIRSTSGANSQQVHLTHTPLQTRLRSCRTLFEAGRLSAVEPPLQVLKM